MREFTIYKEKGWQVLRWFWTSEYIFGQNRDGKHCAPRLRMTAPPYQSYGQDIRDRTFTFACDIVHYCDELLKRGGVGRMLAPQLIRCGTSIGSNLEEARGGESRRDFISKCSIALKEARETLFRLRVADRCELGPKGKAAMLAKEANEIASILGAIVRNARGAINE
jgi:four helix bundle protein